MNIDLARYIEKMDEVAEAGSTQLLNKMMEKICKLPWKIEDEYKFYFLDSNENIIIELPYRISKLLLQVYDKDYYEKTPLLLFGVSFTCFDVVSELAIETYMSLPVFKPYEKDLRLIRKQIFIDFGRLI